MNSTLNRIISSAVFFTAIFSLGCKDDTITNIYLGLTKENRIDETVNVSKDNKLINISVYNFISYEPSSEVNVTLKLPSGMVIIKKTNSSGNVKFELERSITGICGVYAESINNVNSGKTNFEIFETFNYNLSIYIKE